MRSSTNPPLGDAFQHFQANVLRLANAMAHQILRDELARKLSQVGPVRAPRTRPAPITAEPPPPPLPARKLAQQLTLAIEAPVAGGKRTWTRDAIVGELAGWLSSGTEINANFISRHGPPGLVAATRKIFGRFDAALNVAGLHVAKLYPDGPPRRLAGR